MSGIRLDKLTKTYEDGFTAVHQLDLEIESGQFVVLVGPSGCGKSTTLRMIAGLESISDGELTIGDRVVNRVLPKDRDIAMVFQNYALYPHLSVAENLGFALKMSKIPKPERAARVAHAADLLGLSDIMSKKPGQLSGGQRQRVALGRAIVRKPSVFLFDEPLSNLDPDRRASTRAEIRRIQRELGTTTVYVTHDHEEAMALGDLIVIMKDGLIQQAGPPSVVYDQPANSFVGTFLGAPKMNTIPAVLKHDGGSSFAEITDEDGTKSVPIDAERIPNGMNDGASCLLGIRPHSMRVDTTNLAHAIAGTVVDIERLGFTTDLSVRTQSGELRIRSEDALHVALGDAVSLSADPADIHIFED